MSMLFSINGKSFSQCEFKRLSHVTHFYKDTVPLRDPQYGWALEFPYSNMFAVRIGLGIS